MTRPPLTPEQAQRGVQPMPFTKAEWEMLHDASTITEHEGLERRFHHYYTALKRTSQEPQR